MNDLAGRSIRETYACGRVPKRDERDNNVSLVFTAVFRVPVDSRPMITTRGKSVNVLTRYRGRESPADTDRYGTSRGLHHYRRFIISEILFEIITRNVAF